MSPFSSMLLVCIHLLFFIKLLCMGDVIHSDPRTSFKFPMKSPHPRYRFKPITIKVKILCSYEHITHACLWDWCWNLTCIELCEPYIMWSNFVIGCSYLRGVWRSLFRERESFWLLVFCISNLNMTIFVVTNFWMHLVV